LSKCNVKYYTITDFCRSEYEFFIDLFLYDLYKSTSIKFMFTEVDVTL
jgi:hypothetical protein